ncbi:MAG: sortase [Clostridia bacterium]
MSANKYGNTLTVILIIIIVVVVVGGGILLYNYVIKPHNKEKEAAQAIAEFDKLMGEDNNQGQNDQEVDIDEIDRELQRIAEEGKSGTGAKKKAYYGDFVMIGYITIPKTNIKLPILEDTSPKALETSVAVLYPSNPQLNEPGNTVIIGHNYRNGKLFSNNKKLSVGDKVLIKDTTGRELTYTIYQKFEAEANDASFYNRDTNGIPEITLSTCTDDSKKRIIIFAKAD